MRDTIEIQKDNITYYINASKGIVVARMLYPVIKGKVIRGFKEKEYYMYNYHYKFDISYSIKEASEKLFTEKI